MKSIASDSAFKKQVDTLNRTNAMTDEVYKTGAIKQVQPRLFISTELKEKRSFSMHFVTHISRMNSLKQESLPPTSSSVVQRLFKVYHQKHPQLRIKLKPEHCGWVLQNGDIHSIRITLSSAPDEIIKLITCS